MEYACAVCTGQYHLMAGLPCQDRAEGRAEGPVSLVILCDGAGSCPGSEAAAEAVCRWALEDVPASFEALCALDGPALSAELAARGQAALRAAGLGDCLCTMLLFACHEDGRWLAAHIGDGFLFLREGNRARILSWPENGRFAKETFFLCEPDAAQHLRIYRGKASGALQAMLTSDGCGDCLCDWGAKRPAPAVDVMCGWLVDYGGQAASQAMAMELEELFSLRSDDDLSLAILSFSPKAPGLG